MTIQNTLMHAKATLTPIFLKAKAVSPTVLVVGGVVGLVGAAIVACVKTPEAVDILEEINDNVEEARDNAKSGNGDIRGVVKAYACGAGDLVRHYALPISVAGLSIVAIFGSYRLLVGRNVALAGAYKALEESYSRYRDRVREEYGEDADRAIFYGEREELVEGVNEKGEPTRSTRKVCDIQKSPAAAYTFLFDETTSRFATKRLEDNLYYLQCQESYLTDYLRLSKHLSLNEALHILGLEKVKYGGGTGWHVEKVVRDDGSSEFISIGDTYVSFHMNEMHEASGPGVWITFNCQGYVDDLIR